MQAVWLLRKGSLWCWDMAWHSPAHICSEKTHINGWECMYKLRLRIISEVPILNWNNQLQNKFHTTQPKLMLTIHNCHTINTEVTDLNSTDAITYATFTFVVNCLQASLPYPVQGIHYVYQVSDWNRPFPSYTLLTPEPWLLL